MTVVTVIVVMLLAIVAWQLCETAMAYRRAEGSVWDRLKTTFKESATIAWTRLNALSVLLVSVLAEASAWLGAPGIKEAIAPWVGPEYLVAYTLIVLLGAEIARRRTLEN